MLYTCCNYSRNTCQRNCGCGNTTATTNTNNGCTYNVTPVTMNNGCNNVYGIFIPFANRGYWARTTTPQNCGSGTATTGCNCGCGTWTVTHTGNCGCRNLCTSGTTTTATSLNGDAYYARQYGLYGNTGYGCGY